jgi:hypothetical protein
VLLIVGIATVAPRTVTSSIGTLTMLVIGLNSIFGGLVAEALLRRTRRECDSDSAGQRDFPLSQCGR